MISEIRGILFSFKNSIIFSEILEFKTSISCSDKATVIEPILLNETFGINKTYDIKSLKDTKKVVLYYVFNNDSSDYCSVCKRPICTNCETNEDGICPRCHDIVNN